MTTGDSLAVALKAYAPEQLDSSRRGSGLNATWRIRLGSGFAVLKTYATRRGPVQTVLSEVEHRLSGRTSYSAAARQATESRNLRRWKEAGFDVPSLLDHRFDPPLPLPWLAMEYLEGRPLVAVLDDASAPEAEKHRIIEQLAGTWAARHAAAEAAGDPSLLQEHATIDHIMVAGPRLVTLDLEVSYSKGNIRMLAARELLGYLASLFKRLSQPEAERYLTALALAYPDRVRLERIARRFIASPSPWRRCLHALDAMRARARGKTATRYDVARRLRNALRLPPVAK